MRGAPLTAAQERAIIQAANDAGIIIPGATRVLPRHREVDAQGRTIIDLGNELDKMPESERPSKDQYASALVPP